MSKKVLIVGGGAREHAFAWKLRQSPSLGQLFAAPGGNAGIAELAEIVAIKATDIDALLDFACVEKIDLTIVGPEDPLGGGIVDAFQSRHLRIFGPSRGASQIEISKVFSKRLMKSAHVPTSNFVIVEKSHDALVFVHTYFKDNAKPIVIKASGPALGKGVYVCENLAEAATAIDEIFVQRIHGTAGNKVIIEYFVDGPEVSIHAICDGKSFKLFPSSQDHKTIYDGDKGPNTGGMGTIAPVPWFNSDQLVADQIVGPTLKALRQNHTPYTGLLYPGLKMSSDGPQVLEFNARFGDPETQVYMRLMKSDFLEVLDACVDGRLHEVELEWNPGFAVCVVMAAPGYPLPDYKRGLPIIGVDEANKMPGVVVFHAGTKMIGNQLVSWGGRVLGVSAVGDSLAEALDRAYAGVAKIHFDGAQFRTDIGAKSLALCRSRTTV